MTNGAIGFPDGYSDCNNSTKRSECTKSVPYVKAYEPLSKGYDNYIEGNYTRIHRNIQIVNAMRSWLNLNPKTYTEEQLYGKERKKYEYMMNPTTIPISTIPTTILSTINVLPSIIQSTIPTTIPSTILDSLSTIPTTIPITIPSNITQSIIPQFIENY